MGAIAELSIGGISLQTWKNHVPDEIAVLFTEKERRVGDTALPSELEDFFDAGEPSPVKDVRYVTSIEGFTKRLEFFGFTLEAARRAFEVGRLSDLEECRNSISVWERHSVQNSEAANQIIAREKAKIEILIKTNPDEWLDALREEFRKRVQADSARASSCSPASPPVVGGWDLRFPGALDYRFQLRFELEAIEGADAVLDVSDLVNGGYYDAADPISEYAFDGLSARERVFAHLIVVTEGSSDRFYLKSAFELFHPELSEYVSFMDFDGWNVPGGAPFLENLVRSFAGAGIRDRILALFDNDTAGSLSIARLMRQSLPTNIRVACYPDVDIARNYPTLGPTGPANMDVNGAAASVELYLGQDVIQDRNGSFIPIQWKSYDVVINRYQGEISDKRGCRKRFNEKLLTAQQSVFQPDAPNWAELRAIVEFIRTSFTPLKPDALNITASAR